MTRFYQVDQAWQLYQEIQERGIAVTRDAFNSLIRVVCYLREGNENRWQLIQVYTHIYWFIYLSSRITSYNFFHCFSLYAKAHFFPHLSPHLTCNWAPSLLHVCFFTHVYTLSLPSHHWDCPLLALTTMVFYMLQVWEHLGSIANKAALCFSGKTQKRKWWKWEEVFNKHFLKERHAHWASLPSPSSQPPQ